MTTTWDTKPTAGNHQHLIWDEGGKTIAIVYTDAADAALIVRAVNSHPNLVELLRDAVASLKSHDDPDDEALCNQIEAAIRQVAND